MAPRSWIAPRTQRSLPGNHSYGGDSIGRFGRWMWIARPSMGLTRSLRRGWRLRFSESPRAMTEGEYTRIWGRFSRGESDFFDYACPGAQPRFWRGRELLRAADLVEAEIPFRIVWRRLGRFRRFPA